MIGKETEMELNIDMTPYGSGVMLCIFDGSRVFQLQFVLDREAMLNVIADMQTAVEQLDAKPDTEPVSTK